MIKMVPKLLPLAFSLPFSAVWAEDRPDEVSSSDVRLGAQQLVHRAARVQLARQTFAVSSRPG